MFKYLVCVDLAFKTFGERWDPKVASRLGLKACKARMYPQVFKKVSNILQVRSVLIVFLAQNSRILAWFARSTLHTAHRKEMTFEQLSSKYGLKHIASAFPKTWPENLIFPRLAKVQIPGTSREHPLRQSLAPLQLFQRKKNAAFSPVQRAHANFNHPLYVAACFYVTAKVKFELV